MKRKVIQLAHNTLVVSLPSKWARNYGVKKGAEMEVEEHGQQLILSTEKKTENEKIQIDISDLSSDVTRRWFLSALHKSGFDEIEIRFDEQTQIKTVQESVAEIFIGFAIVEQTKNKCVLRIVAKEQEKEFDILLRRSFLVTKSLGQSMLEYIEDGKLKDLNDLLSLEKTNNQLTNFCERILNKKGYKDYKKTCFIYVVVWNLEKICDDYKKICYFLSAPENSNIKVELIKSFLKKANAFFNSYYELFYKFKIDELDKLNVERKEFEKEFLKALKKGTYKEAFVISLLNDFVTKISDFSASYIALNAIQTD